MNANKLMNVTDILTMLKRVNVTVSRNTFYRWISTRYFPQADYTFGRSRRWTEATIKQWLCQCVRDAQA